MTSVSSRLLLPVVASLALTSVQARAQSNGSPLTDPIRCAGDPSQTYALFLPQSYTPERKWPVLLIFDPRGRGKSAAEVFLPAARDARWIILSSNNTQSDTESDVNEKAVRAIAAELHRYSIDEKRIYAAGFSGCATIAWTAGRSSKMFRGVIASGQPWIEALDGAHVPFAYFGAVGTIDFNNADMRRIAHEVSRGGKPYHLAFFDGGHRWMPPEIARQAVEWLELDAMRAGLRSTDAAFIERVFSSAFRHAEESISTGRELDALREFNDIVRDFAGLHDTTAADARASALERSPRVKEQLRAERAADAYEQRTLAVVESKMRDLFASNEPLVLPRIERALDLRAIRNQAKRNGPMGRAADRVLEGLFVQTSFYLPQHYSAQHDDSRVAELLTIAASLKPQRDDVWYELARIQARRHQSRAALDALRQAVALHCGNREALERDPDFESIRHDDRFREIVSQCP